LKLWPGSRNTAFLFNNGKNIVKSIINSVLGCAALVLAFSVSADRAADEKSIRTALGGVEPESVEPTPVPGLYEVVVGANVLYMSADGNYMLQGDLIDVRQRVSLTEASREKARRGVMSAVGEDQTILFAPEKDKIKHTVTVFTDVDCGYCRKLHREMDQYLEAGIAIRYMMYPRAGAGSESYRKAVAVWCAEDQQQAMTDSKAGKDIDMKSCDNPIQQHMELAQQLGLRGTPYLVMENGEVAPGYVPAKALAKMLNEQAGS
jgi:thiol:disulfide interchange protein DsbC